MVQLRKGPSGPLAETDGLSNLRNLPPGNGETIYLQYRDTIGDNGDGHFIGIEGAAAGTYVDDGATVIVPTGGDGSAAWLRIINNVINVAWWGNTNGDISAAFTSAFSYVRNSLVVGGGGKRHVTLTLFVPPGEYRADSTIYWNNLNAYNVKIEAKGAYITINHAGIGIDMIGCRGVHLEDLQLFAEAALPATAGILTGPPDTARVGNMYFEGVTIAGSYITACLWDIGTDTFKAVNVYLRNVLSSTAAWGLLCDGYNNFGATSDLPLRAPGTFQPVTEQEWFGGVITAYNGDYAVYLSGVSEFKTSKDFHAIGAVSCIAIEVSTDPINSLDLNLNTEIGGSPPPDYLLEFLVPAAVTGSIEGFKLDVGQNLATIATVKTTDPGAGVPGNLTLFSAVFDLPDNMASGTYFDAVGITAYGKIIAAQSAILDISNFSAFYGIIETLDSSAITLPAVGHHIIYSVNPVVIDEITLGSVSLITGAGTPEGAVTAVVGSLFLRSDGGAGTSLYVKETGTGNTGWVGK
jgi:hypothetical protein